MYLRSVFAILTTLTFLGSRWCRRAELPAQLDNVTDILKTILEGYDIRLRPNFGGEHLLIGMDMVIASFDSISEVNMDYTLTLYLNQFWTDERLKFSKENYELTLSGDFAEKIWVPDTFFANDKNSFLHEVTEKNKMVRLKSNGDIAYGMRFTTTLACMMDLHYYPLDSQNCTVEIESYGYTVADVVMYWTATPVVGVEDAELPQFSIMKYETTNRMEKLATELQDGFRQWKRTTLERRKLEGRLSRRIESKDHDGDLAGMTETHRNEKPRPSQKLNSPPTQNL
ncbi:gamma-aminobutyric acid receptor subunit beta-like [Caerostris darwini]|uniref:Gamma-aminobutyric acid receptor subunit beta n=1 Tax=Caerostris darwini TaxID=1538125 RepID=A0AAV4S3N2_9ARAC|nr:gamma-aminobutyric acid receptor subunit beta-like [Caerostris darwini]